MVRTLISAGLALIVAATSMPFLDAASDRDEALLLAKLRNRQLSLADGIRQAEASDGPAISAKFEMKGSQLMLSVYTAKRGRQTDAEHNVLMELIGPATTTKWQPEVEVFEDVPHVARSAMQLTVLQLSAKSLATAIAEAESEVEGTAYSAIPAVRDGRPVVDVKLATGDGKSANVSVGLAK
jgi:uncharacterized membrane protein YkoI